MSDLNKTIKEKCKPTEKFMRHIEKQAEILRTHTGVGPEDKLDPRALAEELKLKFVTTDEIEGLSPEDREFFQSLDAKKWSGGIYPEPLPDGKLLIILNPNQTSERANVTIMEEVAHTYYGHKPTKLIIQPNGLEQREYNDKDECEAYWTAGATLLPSKKVAQAVRAGQSAEIVAARFGASVDLVEMRIKTLNLWSYYKREIA